MNRKPRHSARDERGQILVIFALSATALIAMVGLVLDGSGAFAQRRIEQNVADIAALAGANAYMNTDDTVTARTLAAYAAADASATRNGYTDGQGGVVVTPNVVLGSSGAFVTVDITAPHENGFARVVGQNTWDVSVTATAEAGSIDTAVGAAPWIMHVDAFIDGHPIYDEDNPFSFGESNGDFPVSATDIAWTDFNGADNVNTDEVSDIIAGDNVVSARMSEDQYIGQHNNGEHAGLYGQVDATLAGETLPVPIVGDCPEATPSEGGCFKGWAFFYVISATGDSDKTITGYFIDDFKRKPLSVGVCTPDLEAAGECGIIADPEEIDKLVVRLID